MRSTAIHCRSWRRNGSDMWSPGKTQGFKNLIELMVSLDPNFAVTGVAIHRNRRRTRDLGDEIKKDYFRNQFVGKTQDVLKNLKVVKEPLPEDYVPALEPEKAKHLGLSPERLRKSRKSTSKTISMR